MQKSCGCVLCRRKRILSRALRLSFSNHLVMLHYTVTPIPNNHLYEVSLTLTSPSSSLSLFVPAWTSGSYLIRDYAGRFRAPQVSTGSLVQTASNRWIWNDLPTNESVRITWQVFAYSNAIHDAWLDNTRGFINPAALFFIPDELQNETIAIEFSEASFDIFTSLSESSKNRFLASGIQQLLDAPFTLIPRESTATIIDCISHNIPHRLVFTGISSLNKTRLCRDIQAILDETISFWGSTPFNSYVFHIQVGVNLFGGLEHEANSVLQKDILSFPAEYEDEMPKDYDDFLRLLAHEYFHAWLVKFLRPEALLPYRLESPVHTPDLWVFEGLTSYYENLIPFRAGVIDQKTFLSRMSERFRTVREREGFAKETLADASFNAWTHLYKQTADSAYSQSSYYGKGAILAFIIDMFIRSRSKDTKSLDDVLRFWFSSACTNKLFRALPSRGFPSLVETALHLDLKEMIETLSTTLNQETWLAAWNKSLETAGLTENSKESNACKKYLGLHTFQPSNHAITIRYTREDGDAFRSGLFAGDQLIAIDGMRTSPNTLSRQIEMARGRSVIFSIFRNDELLQMKVNVPKEPLQIIGDLYPIDGADITQRFKSTN